MTVEIHRAEFSRSTKAVSARQRQALELRALGTPLSDIARIMGIVTVDAARKLIDRALAAQAELLRSEGAWERAYVLQIERVDALMRVWMPRALAGDEKAADKVDKWLTHYERLQGLAAPQRLEIEATVEDNTAGREQILLGVLARLDEVAHRQDIIDGNVVDAESAES